MAGVAIWVEFTVRPGAFGPFHELVTANAAASLRDEPGCRQFDVLVPDDGAGHDVALYEIYDDAAAFDAHLQTSAPTQSEPSQWKPDSEYKTTGCSSAR